MSKADLQRVAKVGPNTTTKLHRDEDVSLAALGEICTVRNTNIGDIMDFVPGEERHTHGE